jgi:DNA-binding LacI/PurR family transcriptional regulator
VDGSLDRRTGYAAGQHLLALDPRPTAIVVDPSIGGIGLIRALLDAQVSIGRTMSIVINGGIPEDTLFSGMTVAAVHQPTPYRSGQVLGEMVKRLLGRGADQTPALADLQRLEQSVHRRSDVLPRPCTIASMDARRDRQQQDDRADPVRLLMSVDLLRQDVLAAHSQARPV